VISPVTGGVTNNLNTHKVWFSSIKANTLRRMCWAIWVKPAATLDSGCIPPHPLYSAMPRFVAGATFPVTNAADKTACTETFHTFKNTSTTSNLAQKRSKNYLSASFPGQPILHFIEARDDTVLGICTSHQTDHHIKVSSLNFRGPDVISCNRQYDIIQYETL